MLEFLVTQGPNPGSVVPFPGARFTIGSDASCQLRFDASQVRPQHAEVATGADGRVWVRDLSGGQTFLDGRPLAQHETLKVGSFLRLGTLELALRQQDSGPSGTLHVPTPLRSFTPVDSSSANAIDATAKRPSPGLLPQVPPLDAMATGATAKRPSAGRLAALAPSDDALATGATAKRPSAGRLPAAQAASAPSVPLGDSVSASGSIRVNLVINGRYRVLRRLASGGMGEVYQAEHVELGRIFALKVMKPELSNDQEFVERFKREAVASSRIGQQNIVDITDFGRTEEGAFYFVMEFLEGDTLASVIHRQGAQAIPRALHVFAQVCRALAAAHQQGIVHRDLKPENIMLLQRTGQPDLVKVLDFGVAKVSSGHGAGGQTAVGMVVGTPQYMSPEQAAGLLVDARSDIYSLGLIFYELLAGRTVFTGATPSILMVKQMVEPPPPLAPGPVGPVPPELEGLIFQMLAKKPEERPPTMDAVLAVIEPLLSQVRRTGTVPAVTPSAALAAAAGTTPSGGFRAPSGGYPAGAGAAAPGASASGGFRAPSGGFSVGGLPVGPVGQPGGSAPAFTTGEHLAVKRSKAPLFLVAGLLLVAAGGGGAYFALARTTPPPQSPPQTPVAQPVVPAQPAAPAPPVPAGVGNVLVTLLSEPVGAEVFEGETPLGVTPVALQRSKGPVVAEYTFRLAGHKPATLKVPLSADREVRAVLEREKTRTRRPTGPAKPGEGDLKDIYEQEEDLKSLPE